MSRLIDADKFSAISYIEKSKDFTEGVEFVVNMIDNAPTIQAIPIEEVLKIIEFEEKWLYQTRMSIRDIDIALDAMKSKIKQIEGSGEE